jgi:8-oxo-dGTP diphosphatase
MIRVRRLLLRAFGGLYNDLIGRRSHLGAAGVIFDADGRILLVRHSYGRRNWELPGGGRKANESVEQAVRREVREEVGVEAVVERLCGIYYEPEMDQHHFAFVCRLPDGAIPRVTSAELLACEYWAPDKLPRPISDFTLRRIDDARAGRAPTSIAVLGPRRWIV